VTVTFRVVAPEEYPAYGRACALGFGESPTGAERHARWYALDPERVFAGFDGDDIVATCRNYGLELTVPGGAILPAAGVSAVTVRATHRRRGLLRTMMIDLLDDAVAHDEPVAMLTASEGSIYERFGFGISTRHQVIELRRRDVEFARPRPPGRLRILDADEAAKVEPALFDRVRRVYPGAINRPDAWWSDEQYDPRFGSRVDVAFESPDGVVDGYACYGVHEGFDPALGSANRLTVRDLVAATPDALHGLWRYLCEVDLVGTIMDPGAPVDLPLPWLLTTNRAMRVKGVPDAVWTRILDVPATLGARRYAAADRLTIAVTDTFRPGGPAEGTFTLDGGPDGAAVTEGGEPELAGDVSALSAAWLGGVRFSTLAAAGLVEERTAGALRRADQLFASEPQPFPFTWF
jgi:predicted acetyltransferase